MGHIALWDLDPAVVVRALEVATTRQAYAVHTEGTADGTSAGRLHVARMSVVAQAGLAGVVTSPPGAGNRCHHQASRVTRNSTQCPAQLDRKRRRWGCPGPSSRKNSSRCRCQRRSPPGACKMYPRSPPSYCRYRSRFHWSCPPTQNCCPHQTRLRRNHRRSGHRPLASLALKSTRTRAQASSRIACPPVYAERSAASRLRGWLRRLPR
jgi:hypothetical protein